MKTIVSKNKIILFIIILLSVSSFTVAHASIIDDFLNVIGVNKDIKTNQADTKKINEEIEDYLDSRQKEVVDSIDEIYNDILEVNIDSISEKIDYSLPSSVRKNVAEFFENYEGSKDNVKSILKTINYRIENMSNEGERIIAKITYTYPSIPKVITKILPELIIKNAGILFGANLNNDILNSVLESLKNELAKGTYETESFTRNFSFKKIDGRWKLVDVSDIVKDAEKYINDIGKKLF